jgi:hypothetical protein
MRIAHLSLTLVLGVIAPPASTAHAGQPLLPITTAPIVYTIDYSGKYFEEPDYIDRYRPAPPDLLHMGKAVPISHLWGPIRLYAGENQLTGGPGNTLSWENIALLTPEALAARVENIRRTLKRYHALGIREITPYISYHTLAGDHERRLGFWKFYDEWEKYVRWAGPRPAHDPLDWLVVDRTGRFVPGSCGGYAPDYYAPLHRYRACINHPDWAEWHRRLVRLVAEVGYDGCFVDNAGPDPCYCRYCRQAFQQFLGQQAQVEWVARLTKGLKPEQLALDAPDLPDELVRRWRLLCTARHLGMLREVGRRVKPGFTIFPNGNSLPECQQVGSQSDRLMFESTYAPGIDSDDPRDTAEIAIAVSDQPPAERRIRHRCDLNDPDTWMELKADLELPAAAQVGRPARLTVKVLTVGGGPADNDAAEDFFLLLRRSEGDEQRIGLEPRGAVGGLHSSRKPRTMPATLHASWTPQRPGRYTVEFGFRYTDDGHGPKGILHPHRVALVRDAVCRTHQASLLFAQHMHARSICLGYDAMRRGAENVQELSLAEMAAFSGGGGFSARGAPQFKYRTFFRQHPTLFAGWQPTAPLALLFSGWGQNTLRHTRLAGRDTIHEHLAGAQQPFVTFIDTNLPDNARPLATFRAIYLESSAYDLTGVQLAALADYVRHGGRVVLANEKVTINGQPAGTQLPTAGTVIWDPRQAFLPTAPIAPGDGPQRNLRYALYQQPDRLTLHIVNYNVSLVDAAKRIYDVEAVPLSVPLPADWHAVRVTAFDPDAPTESLAASVVADRARVTVPRCHVYKIVLLERQP